MIWNDVDTELLLEGEWGELHGMPRAAPARAAVVALDELPDLLRKAVLARCMLLLDLGPRLRCDWFKQLEGADGIRQVRCGDHRLWLFDRPTRQKAYLLLSCHPKRKAETRPDQLRRARQLRSDCIAWLIGRGAR